MNKCRLLVSSIALSVCAYAGVPTITESSVVLSQDRFTRLVTVDYTLENAPGVVTVDIQTNRGDGVYASIGVKNFTRVYGDVNRVVSAGAHHLYWQPQEDWPDVRMPITEGGVRAVITAWALDFPPDYMVVDLEIPNRVNYYVSEDAIPGGIDNREARTNKLIMRKIHAAGLTWREGAPSNEPGRNARETVRPVVLTQDYYAGIYPITQGQWRHYTAIPRNCASTGLADSDLFPVSGVSWALVRGDAATYDWPNSGDAVGTKTECFAGWLRDFVGGSMKFDLPTSAQWEFACRAGEYAATNNGKNTEEGFEEIAWYDANCTNAQGVAQLHIVGTKKPNAWGIYDMHGQVREWCLNSYYNGRSQSEVIDPTCDTVGQHTVNSRVYRAGCYRDNYVNNRSAYYYANAPTYTHGNHGFRIFCPAVIANPAE